MSRDLVSADHPFGPQTLAFGVFSTDANAPRVGVRLGDDVIDVSTLAGAAGREDLAAAWATPSLNAFLALGHEVWADARAWLTETLGAAVEGADDRRAIPSNWVSSVQPDGVAGEGAGAGAGVDALAAHRHSLEDVTLHLPIEVADYVDFYASAHHASNVGKIFRPDNAALPPNWKHLPIGYHGRAGTVVVDGTDITRPTGQRKAPADPAPTFGPSIRLDIEAELGYVVGGATTMGSRVSVDEAAQHIFGVVILNDWSARDIQAWEYVPLGPFLGKSFGTSISAWVTPLAAFDSARVALPREEGDPEVLDYLRGGEGDGVGAAFGLDIHVEVSLNGTVISRPENRDMYWSPAQMLAHMTVNGASLRNGDLFGSGTISGAEKPTRGSLLELSWSGTEPLTLDDGSTRGFLEDGDTVTMTAWAPGPDGTRVGLGQVSGTITPAT
ncbi:fumarylacetoacetase [Knoellia sinensis KCTC 19936]|uniref:fumarylacetoacetase n=1 Tax=Knoellia sinensis KCTC 19936 TaxID=1385520 RepID=A0A0A0J565_9MICO|nr:fumarylacetoacetase [Knoellia sinensis]KGN30756.1 fumarylacetoacetase [Knoellia sinensis KCTC 19936]